MQLMVNGKTETFDGPLTISGYLKLKEIDTKLVVIEWNFKTPPRDQWDQIYLDDGDNLEIIKIIGGG